MLKFRRLFLVTQVLCFTTVYEETFNILRSIGGKSVVDRWASWRLSRSKDRLQLQQIQSARNFVLHWDNLKTRLFILCGIPSIHTNVVQRWISVRWHLGAVVVVVVVVVRVSPDWHCLVCRVTAGTEETGQTRHSSPHTDGQSVLTWELRLRTEKLTQLIVNKAGLGLVREWVREWGREWGREGGFTTKHHHCQGYRTGETGRHHYLYY